MSTISSSEWIWMGHAGHFIGSQDCQFHMNTYVNGYIVSTIGEYLPRGEKRSNDWHEIGLNRKYETYVFIAKPGEHDCCPWEPADFGSVVDSNGYNRAIAAYHGHMEMCEKFAKNPTPGQTDRSQEEM